MKPRTHKLKTWPEPFRAVVSGAKRHEVRTNDRGFAVGDLLELREWEPSRYQNAIARGGAYPSENAFTGDLVVVRVTYVTPGGSFGLPFGVCVMTIEPIDKCESCGGPEYARGDGWRCTACDGTGFAPTPAPTVTEKPR